MSYKYNDFNDKCINYNEHYKLLHATHKMQSSHTHFMACQVCNICLLWFVYFRGKLRHSGKPNKSESGKSMKIIFF